MEFCSKYVTSTKICFIYEANEATFNTLCFIHKANATKVCFIYEGKVTYIIE